MTQRTKVEGLHDIPYLNHEVNREIGAVNRDFMLIDGDGPLGNAVQRARTKGKLSVLDAGCGSGVALAGLKDQVEFRSPLDLSCIDAEGISLTDLRADYSEDWRIKGRLYDGYIAYRMGNLASIELKPNHFDIAYSYQVLLHNESVTPIVNNVLKSLRPDGMYYFDTLEEQDEEVMALGESLDSDKWTLQTKNVTREFFDGVASRLMHKISRTP